jgi:hypothetical protein
MRGAFAQAQSVAREETAWVLDAFALEDAARGADAIATLRG